jgi:hypothetical protein
VLYYTTSPHRLIPPLIKRSRIMVSGGVVLANLGKSLKKIVGCNICGCAYLAGKFLFSISYSIVYCN